MNNRVKLLLVAIPIILASCSKKALPPIIPFTPISSSTVAIEEIDFDYLHGKARMILKDGNKEREVKANIRVRKDSVIWMNFTVIHRGRTGAGRPLRVLQHHRRVHRER
jgi:hypothetical protein